jgi:hypothetical protein
MGYLLIYGRPPFSRGRPPFSRGTVYGIELLNANEQLGRGEKGSVLIVNEATGQEVEVPIAVP